MAERVTQAAWDAKRALAKAKAREALSKATEDDLQLESDELEDSSEGYGEWSKDELVEELKVRELPHSGTKDELIARLDEADEAETTD